jgi:hypothetical protein
MAAQKPLRKSRTMQHYYCSGSRSSGCGFRVVRGRSLELIVLLLLELTTAECGFLVDVETKMVKYSSFDFND